MMWLPEMCFGTNYMLTAYDCIDTEIGLPVPSETHSGRCMVYERAASKFTPEEAKAGTVVRAILRETLAGDLHRYTNGTCVLTRNGETRTMRVAQAKRTCLPHGKEYVMLELMGCE